MEIEDKQRRFAEAFRLYKMWVDPLVRCISINKCSESCLPNMLYVEQHLCECGHLPNVYPNIWGCPNHGTLKIISLNHPSMSFYCIRWKAFLARQKITQGTCSNACRYIHVPQMFHLNNEIQYHFETMIFCPTHGGVHFCCGLDAPCGTCDSCKLKQPCPFQCIKHTQRGTCFVTGVLTTPEGDVKTIEDIDRQHASANNHSDFREGLDVRNTPRRVNLIIAGHIKTWIASAKHNTRPLSQSIETLFAKWMDIFCYVCTNEDGSKTYLYPNIQAIRFINNAMAINHIPFPDHKHLDEMIFFVWNLLRYHIKEIFEWPYVIALVAHLNAENGLCMGSMTIPLNPQYAFAIMRIHHTDAPKKPIRCNISVISQQLCSWIEHLNAHQQKNVYDTLCDHNLPLFLYYGHND